jgi:hypothetical protein
MKLNASIIKISYRGYEILLLKLGREKPVFYAAKQLQ